jgi:hypothetical protein
MRYYCPNCWKDFWEQNFEKCPNCGYDTKKSKNDYIDRLINALNHPSGDIRNFALYLLVEKKAKRAIPYLETLAVESGDPSLVKATKEAIMKLNAFA